MKERYRNILEKVYEVEGLLLLAMSKDEMPEGLDNLIERRLSELMAEEDVTLSGNTDSGIGGTSPEMEACNDAPEPIHPQPDEVTDASDDETIQAHENERNDGTTEGMSAEGEEENTFYALDDEEDEDSQPEHFVDTRDVKRKAPVFSINDRFLFIRELFDGDVASFNTAIDRLSRCRDWEEAQIYLTEICGLRPDDEEADARFMDIMEAHFRNC